MAENILMLAFMAAGVGAIILTPWFLIGECIYEWSKGRQGNELGFIICLFICVMQLCMAIDWITGSKSFLDF